MKVLPWVVGVRGVLDTEGIQRAMEFLEIPESKRGTLLRKTASASVEALVYMHKVRTSGATRASRHAADVQSGGSEGGRRLKRRREDNASNCWDRWKLLSTDPMRLSLRSLGA